MVLKSIDSGARLVQIMVQIMALPFAGFVSLDKLLELSLPLLYKVGIIEVSTFWVIVRIK